MSCTSDALARVRVIKADLSSSVSRDWKAALATMMLPGRGLRRACAGDDCLAGSVFWLSICASFLVRDSTCTYHSQQHFVIVNGKCWQCGRRELRSTIT